MSGAKFPDGTVFTLTVAEIEDVARAAAYRYHDNVIGFSTIYSGRQKDEFDAHVRNALRQLGIAK